MISQILPYLLSADKMTLVSIDGRSDSFEGEELAARKVDDVSEIVPEAIEMDIAEEISIPRLLEHIMSACTAHQAHIYVDDIDLDPEMSLLVLRIVFCDRTFPAFSGFVGKSVMFVLSPPSDEPA